MRTPRNDQLTETDRAKGRGQHVPERRCVITGEVSPAEQLVRLALGPDGTIAPDVHGKAPGRGAWIGVDRAAVDAANAKGKLKGALARAFKTNDLTVPTDLGARIEHALRQAVPGGFAVSFSGDLGGGLCRLLLRRAEQRRDDRGRADGAVVAGESRRRLGGRPFGFALLRRHFSLP